MAYESSIIVGSGQNPLKNDPGFCSAPGRERFLRGTQVVVINPEDSSAGGSGLASQITVSTSLVKIPTAPLKYRRAIAIFNSDATATLFIGFDTTLTTGNGFPIPPSSSLPMDLNGAVEVYAIAPSAIDVRILELS